MRMTTRKEASVLSRHRCPYHIVLPLLSDTDTNCDILVQINPRSSLETRLLHLNALRSALIGDPDLAHIPDDLHPRNFQVLFICSGCEYISFFAGYGKATFLRCSQQAHFSRLPGTLDDSFLVLKRASLHLYNSLEPRISRSTCLPFLMEPLELS